jgi:hypothetical protein
MRVTHLTVATLALALAGCREQQASGAIPRQRFVLANADLRSVSDTAARGDSLRRAALSRHHVTEADLRRFVQVHERSPAYLAAVWREVADSVEKRYTRTWPRHVGPPPGAGTPGVVQTMQPVAPPQTLPAVVRGGEVRKPPPPPDQPPPPVTEPPRQMVRGQLPPPPRRQPPAGPPPDATHPMTRPGQRPLVPNDSVAPTP